MSHKPEAVPSEKKSARMGTTSTASRVSFGDLDDVSVPPKADDIKSKSNEGSDQSTRICDVFHRHDQHGELTGAASDSSLLVDDQKTSQSKILEDEANFVRKAKMIGGKYTQHEFAFALSVGIVLSFNAGYVNGACLSGLLTPNGVQQSVAGFTGAYTIGALALADGQFEVFGRQTCMILSFILGSCISGAMTPDARAHRLEPTYGPTFLLGGACLIVASIMAAVDEETYFFYFAAAANGIQNGMSSLYSANLIRSTHLTGTSTDIGLFLGQVLRGRTKNLWKLIFLCILATSFWLGGIISFYVTRRTTHYSLLFNAALYIGIGMALVVFLVYELKVSVMAALIGNWMWERVFDQLEATLRKAASRQGEEIPGQGDLRQPSLTRSQHLAAYFDSVHRDHGLEEGLLDGETLFQALQESGIRISREEVDVLIEKADKDGNDRLSKEEWIKIAREAHSG